MNFKVIFVLALGAVCALIFVLSKNKARTLLSMICFLYVFPLGWIFYHYTGILLIDIPLLALLLVQLLSGQHFRFYFKGFSLPLLLIMAGMSISATQAVNVGWAVAEISKWLRGYLVFIVVANAIRNPGDLRAAFLSVLAGFLFQSFLAVYQWRIGTMGLWFLGERIYRSEPWRSYGTFFVPSFLANYLIIILPLAMRLGVFYRHPKFRDRALYFGAFLIGTMALYTTYGRSAWLGFVISSGLLFGFSLLKSGLRPRLKWPLMVLLVFSMAFMIKYMPAIERQFGTERKGAVDIRFIQFQVAWNLIKDRPILGAGPGNYELVAPNYIFYVPNFPQWLLWEMVHNTYLLLTAENGVMVGLLFIIFLLQFFRIGIALLKSKSNYIVNFAVGIMGGILAIGISFIASPDIHNEQTINQLMIMAGMLMGLVTINSQITRRSLSTPKNYPVSLETLGTTGMRPSYN